MNKKEKEALASLGEKLARWRAHPELFPLEAFAEPVTPELWQTEALKAFAHNDRIAIKSGHGVGKSAWLAWLILLILLTRNPIRIPCTAPSAPQLEHVLWAEIAHWHRKLHPYLRSLLTVKSDKVEFVPTPSDAFAIARTARKEQPEAFQGVHSRHVVYIADEASGVDEAIFNAASGAMSTPGAKTVMTGNPTRLSGYFFDAFNPRAGERAWWTKTVSCFDSTQVEPSWIEEIQAKFGTEHYEYRVRVLGEFPLQEDDTVIPLELIEAATSRDIEPAEGPVVWGVDVARYGRDRSAVAKRMLNCLLEPVTSWGQIDLMQTTGRIVAMYEMTHEFRRPKEILVDAIGLGAGVADRLREQGLPAKAIQVSEKPGIMERFLRERDELWYRCREWFDSREVMLPNDEALIAELKAQRHTYTSSGKYRVLSKDEMRKLGQRSPDLADAFVLTFAASHQYKWAAGMSRVASDRPLPMVANSKYSPFKLRRRHVH
jgi:hypothetical protein